MRAGGGWVWGVPGEAAAVAEGGSDHTHFTDAASWLPRTQAQSGWAGAQGWEPAQALSLPSSRAPSPSRPAGEFPRYPHTRPSGQEPRPRLPQLGPGLLPKLGHLTAPRPPPRGLGVWVWRRVSTCVCGGGRAGVYVG